MKTKLEQILTKTLIIYVTHKQWRKNERTNSMHTRVNVMIIQVKLDRSDIYDLRQAVASW